MSTESLELSSEDTKPKGPKEVIVTEPEDTDESTLGSSDEDQLERARPDVTPEYWHIQKLIRYLKTGNQTATIMSLCCLKDHDLSNEMNQMAIQDMSGLEVLINLLECESLTCKLGALNVLIELSKNRDIKKCMVNFGCIPILIKNLSDPARDLQIKIAETIHYVAQIRKGRRQVRKSNGIEKLIDLLDVPERCLNEPEENLDEDEFEYVNIATAASRALWSVSKSRRNIKVMITKGAIPLLAKLIKSVHMDVVLPASGVISQCSVDRDFQIAIYTEEMVKDVVQHLHSTNELLQRHCAETIFKCAEDKITRDMVREAGGLDPLVKLAKNPDIKQDKLLLAAITGAIWKCAISPENVERLDQLKTVEALVELLEDVDEDERVLSNVVGALYECLKFTSNREVLRRANGIPYLVDLLNYTYPPLLENVPMVLRECAEDEESMRIIEQLDGVRLIWSLLKNDSPKVQANAAWSLVPCIRNATDSGELIRCFVGGLVLMVNRLKSTDTHVLACTCAAIAEVAKDPENLGIISDHGVIPMLVSHVETNDVELREHLASAIAYCCSWGSNCKTFGRLGAITPLVAYMTDSNPNVHRTAAMALYHLSKNPFNCVTMHESGVVKFLLKAIASDDYVLQEAAAGCLANIRKLALEAETVHLVREEKESSDDEDDNAAAK